MGAELGGADKAKSEPNIVPLADILLVLLIIFMVVTPMIKKGVHVKLPNAQNTQDQPDPGELLTVFVKADGSVFLGSAKIELPKLAVTIEDTLQKKLEKGSKPHKEFKTKVLLNADIATEYGKIVDVMNEIKNANIEKIGLVTKKTSGN